MALGITLEELNKLLEEKKKKIAALPKPLTAPGKIGKPIQPLKPQQIAAQQLSQAFAPLAPAVPQIAQQQGLAPGEFRAFQSFVPPVAPAPQFLGPGAAQAARFQGIAPSATIPPVEIRQPQQPPRSIGEALATGQAGPLRFLAGGSLAAEARAEQQTLAKQQTQVSQLVSPHTGRRPFGTGQAAILGTPVTPGKFTIPPATEQQLSYLDTLRATDPDRALEVARFQSATIGRNTPESALATSVFFTEHAIFDLGQLARNASEGVWDVIAQRQGYDGTGADLLTELGYIPIGGGLWFLPDGDEGVAGAGTGVAGAGGGGAFRLITSRAPIFSGQPGRFEGTRGASFGLTNWRI